MKENKNKTKNDKCIECENPVLAAEPHCIWHTILSGICCEELEQLLDIHYRWIHLTTLKQWEALEA